MTGTLARPVGRLLDLAFPASCLGCGVEGEPICPACSEPLRVRERLPPGLPIGLPSNVPPPLLQLEWCSPFSGLVRDALHALKYGGERRLARPLGEAAADRWRFAGNGAEVVAPVPVHRERRRERGYDQAELLATVVADRLGLPVLAPLERHQATRPQFALGHAARRRNVATAFGPTRSAGAVRGRWVLLVDDVVTTGATLSACAEVLLEAGAVAVSALAIARER